MIKTTVATETPTASVKNLTYLCRLKAPVTIKHFFWKITNGSNFIPNAVIITAKRYDF